MPNANSPATRSRFSAAGADESEAYGRTILRLLSSWSRTTPSPGVVGILEDRRDLKLLHIAEFRPGRRFGMVAMLGVALAGAVTLTGAQTTTNSAASKAASTTNLPPVVPLRYTNSLSAPENKDPTSGGNWAGAPRGSNVLGGVHFEIDGLVQLASKSSVGYQREFREYVSLPIPTNRYGSVHLLAATAWSSEPNRRIADVLWRCTDGTLKRSPILYTGHVRDWWRKPFEEPHHVYSKFAKAAAIWSSTDAAKNGAALRMYRVSLANPEPARTVASLQVQSALENASLLFLAVSLDPLAPGQRPDPTPDLEPEDPKWTGHLGVNVIDAGTSNVIGGASVVAVVRGDKASGERSYTANGSGVADVTSPTHEPRDEPIPPAISGVVQMTLRLKKSEDWSGTVVDASGRPVARASVALSGNFGNVSLQNGRLESHSDSVIVLSGPDGSFKLNAVQNPIAVVAASPDGFGVATVDEFRTTRRIRLLPYGRVEGTHRGRVDDNGTAKISLQLFTGTGGSSIGVSGDWGGFQNPVASGATFSFTRVPAGDHQIVRLVQAGANSWTHAPLKDAPVEPGKTTTVDITIEGIRVLAQIASPPGLDITGFQRHASLQSATPFRVKPGMTQKEIETLVANPEFMEAMKRVKHFPCTLRSDGSVIADDVPAGSYDLQVSVFESKNGKTTQGLTAMQSFTVPEGAETGSTLDLGPLPLVPQVLPGETQQP